MRRSSKIKRAETPAYSEAESEPKPEDDEEFVEAATRKSRGHKRKTPMDRPVAPPVRKTKKKRGMLRQIIEMPTDVLFEIFGHLKPLDLVHLARTTKDLRALLMSRSSISVWRTARLSAPGLPDCPDDLNEPQYAILVFGKSCSFCLRNLTTHISWSGRVRCCNKCLDIHFEAERSPEIWAANRRYPSLLAPWIPRVKTTRQILRRGERVAVGVWNCLWKVDRQWRTQYAALENPQSKYDWLHQRLEERYAIEKHARECERWYKYDEIRQHDPLDPHFIIAERMDEVLEYVKELGFEEELYKIHPMVVTHPIVDLFEVKQACKEPLTPSILSTLKPLLTTTMKKCRQQRRLNEHRELLEHRKILLSMIHAKCIEDLPINEVYPNIHDLYVIVEEHDFMDYSKSTMDALRVPFSDIVALWKSKIESKLISLIVNARGSDHVLDQENVFDLATTFFECSNCLEVSMRHERAMMHPCASRARTSIRPENPSKEQMSELVFKQAPWGDLNAIKFNKTWLETVSEVVVMAGMDPNTATARDMDKRDPIYECRTCNSIIDGRATMRWDAVVDHKRSHHHRYDRRARPQTNSLPPMVLQLLAEPEASKVRERMQEERERAVYRGDWEIMCPHCRSTERRFDVYMKHLQKKHDVKRVIYSDLIFPLDQRRIFPLFWLWPPREQNSDNED